ncbi:MAG: glycogen debranching protein GlgX, partial [Pseudonocardiaceae bacterium]
AMEGGVRWDEAVFSHKWGSIDERNDSDSAPYVPRSIVVNPYFDWENDRLLKTPWSDTVIYEMHVKGATMRHPDVDPQLRGTYAGVAHPAFIEHLQSLGVTAVELQPIHQFVHDAHLVQRGLRNYWGYNSIGFFAPHDEYASRSGPGAEVQDCKAMVKALHRAGLEVILDVVYNHTAEGNHLGPTLCFKGLDNAAYYRLVDDDRRFYMDYTGTGNTLNMRHPFVLQLMMDSLRYWIQEVHVDGFRFDLASTLARGLHEVDRLSAFFDLIHQDPVVSQVKLIAEPWDVGEGGYQVGNFPAQWTEWNGRYRDCIRDHWRGANQTLGEFAYRITGSSDLYEASRRRPHASVNFVTAHDGFTLRDLVSYDTKHNEANGENNRDGTDDNRSSNYGVEGPTDNTDVLALRARQQRNFLATLLLSQGIPMVLAGDELGRTQGGNNNAYGLDDETSWMDWESADLELLEFSRRLIRFRLDHLVFRRRSFFQGRPIRGSDISDLAWFGPDGTEMTDDQWDEDNIWNLALFINGDAVERGSRGELLSDDTFVLCFNAHHAPVPFTLPAAQWGQSWQVEMDTALGGFVGEGSIVKSGEVLDVDDHCVVVLRRIALDHPS